MELNDLILLAAAALFRASDGSATSGGRIPGPDPYVVAVAKAKRLWSTVLSHEHDE